MNMRGSDIPVTQSSGYSLPDDDDSVFAARDSAEPQHATQVAAQNATQDASQNASQNTEAPADLRGDQ